MEIAVDLAVDLTVDLVVEIAMASAMGLHDVPLLAATFRGSPWNVRGTPWSVRGSPWSVRGCPWNSVEIAVERRGGPWALPRCSAKKKNNVHPLFFVVGRVFVCGRSALVARKTASSKQQQSRTMHIYRDRNRRSAWPFAVLHLFPNRLLACQRSF